MDVAPGPSLPHRPPFTSAIEGPLASLVSSLHVFEDKSYYNGRATSFLPATATREQSNISTIALTFFLLFALAYVVMHDYRRIAIMPPGPLPIPLVGNKWDLPSSKPWYKFQQWTALYGPLVTMWTGRRPTIVLGSPQAAHDLLERRSNNYSSRPRFVVMGELFTNNDSLLTMPYGHKWRRTRKIFKLGLKREACASYKPIQEAESRRLASELLHNPEGFERHLERYAASIMICVAYGRRVDDLDDSVLKGIYQRMRYMATLNVPGAYWAESFPFLKRLPDFLAPWKREVKRQARESEQLLFDLANQVRHQIEDGEAPASFTKTLWEKHMRDPEDISEREIAYATGSLFGAGSDTSSATLQSFVLAMTCFPEVAERAAEEMDRVVGQNRSPTWEDEPNLPYCNAVIKETLRWRPVAVLGGTPHASIKDDYYKGHFIPKGTTVLGSLWSIHHDSEYFEESHRFMPERYLEPRPDGLKPYPNHDGHSAFGWGRRGCPGKIFAENSLFIAISRILWGFKISKARDPVTGQEITPDIDNYTDGFNSKPRPFQCCIVPRSNAIREVVERETRDAEEFLDQYKPQA